MSDSPITVVIPTYNRAQTLRLCLEHLEHQTEPNFRVIVINDGSTDGTATVLQDFLVLSSLRMQVLTQQNSGPARGRNLAIARVETEYCLLIGDDVLVTPTFVESHLRLHQTRSELEVVGLGWTQWDTKHQALTPFMVWVEDLQFDYKRLRQGVSPDWRHFYTSNLSFKTELLRSNPFDERFKSAGWEDSELGYRLATKQQLKLVFLEEARATHVHPTTLANSVKRMHAVGQSESQFDELWPAAQGAKKDLRTRVCAAFGSRPTLLTWLTRVIEQLPSTRLSGKLWALVLLSHHQLGYRQDRSRRND